jgi:hypothetical protein
MTSAHRTLCKPPLAFPGPGLPAEEEGTREILSSLRRRVSGLVGVGLRNCKPHKESKTLPRHRLEIFLEALSEPKAAIVTAQKYKDTLGKPDLSDLISFKSCNICRKDIESRCYASIGLKQVNLWHPSCLPCTSCKIPATRGGYNYFDQPEKFRNIPISCKLCGGPQADSTIVFMPNSERMICGLYVELFRVASLRERRLKEGEQIHTTLK